MKKIALTILLGCVTGFCHAQDVLPLIFPDRPGALTGTDVMALHKIQWENGIGFEARTDGPRTLTISNTQFRFGLFEHTELRLGADFLMAKDTPGAKPAYGFAPLDIELKTKFYEGSGLIPSVAFLAGLVSSHVGTRWLLPSHLSPEMHLLLENTVCDWIDVCFNAGVIWDGETPVPTTFLGLGFDFNLTNRLGFFVESYNYLHPTTADQYMTEFGFTFLASRRIQLDIFGDLDLGHFGKFFNVSCGFAWLLN